MALISGSMSRIPPPKPRVIDLGKIGPRYGVSAGGVWVGIRTLDSESRDWWLEYLILLVRRKIEVAHDAGVFAFKIARQGPSERARERERERERDPGGGGGIRRLEILPTLEIYW